MTSNTSETARRLKNAISERMTVRFSYNDLPRVVEPYAFGRTGDGKRLLRAYQIAGRSSSDGRLGWRLFDIALIRDFDVAGDSFSPSRRDYNPNDPVMTEYFARI